MSIIKEKSHPAFSFVEALYRNNVDNRIKLFKGNHRCFYSPIRNTNFWDYFEVTPEIEKLYYEIYKIFHDEEEYEKIKEESKIVEVIRSIDLEPLNRKEWDPYGFRSENRRKFNEIKKDPSWIQKYHNQKVRVERARKLITNLGLNPGSMFSSVRAWPWCF